MQAKLGGWVIASGTLPRDAELKFVGDKQTPLCKFGIKVDERQSGDSKEAVWANCTCWRGVAYAAAKFVKGDTVLAIGSLQTRTYTGRDGDEKSATELVCEFVSRMEVSESVSYGHPAAPPQAVFTELNDVSDDELPF